MLCQIIKMWTKIIFHNIAGGSLSVSWEYLALPGGPGGFRQDSSCPALLRILLSHNVLTCTSLSLSMDELSRTFQLTVTWILQSYNPAIAVTITV